MSAWRRVQTLTIERLEIPLLRRGALLYLSRGDLRRLARVDVREAIPGDLCRSLDRASIERHYPQRSAHAGLLMVPVHLALDGLSRRLTGRHSRHRPHYRRALDLLTAALASSYQGAA